MGCEAAVDHPLAVERHRVRVRLQPRVGHHLGHAGVARLARWPFDPGEDHRLVGLALHGHREGRDLALGHVVAPALDAPERAVLLEDGKRRLRVLAKGLAVRGGDRGDKSVDIAHAVSSFGSAGSNRNFR